MIDAGTSARQQLVELLSHELFDPPHDTTCHERSALTYRRLRYIGERLGVDGPLLLRRDLLSTLLELAATVDPSLFHALFLHHCMTIGALLEFGTPGADLRARLEDLQAGATVGAVLMTELGHGNSASSIRTEAHYDIGGHEFVLHTPGREATKFPPNVGLDTVPRLGVIGARLVAGGRDRGVFLFAVGLRDAAGRPCHGVEITPQPATALLPLDYAAVSFQRVRLPFSSWLSDSATIARDGAFSDPLAEPGARTRRTQSLPRFGWGAAAIGLAAVARASVAIALSHAARRQTNSRFSRTGMPVIQHRNQQRLLFSATASALAATAVAADITDACWDVPAAVSRGSRAAPRVVAPSALRTAALVKVAADRLAESAISRCRAACGGLGFLSVNRLVDYQGLALAFNAAGGDNQMLLLESAWAMVSGADYEPPSGDDGLAEGRSMLDPDAWISLLGSRERRLHHELRERMERAARRGHDELGAWNHEVESAQLLAETHVARITISSLRAAADVPSEPRTVNMMLRLCALRVLEEIAAHDGWYLSHGLLTAEQVTGIPDLTGRLCEELMPDIAVLMATLRVPTEITRAPLAGHDYIAELASAPVTPHHAAAAPLAGPATTPAAAVRSCAPSRD